MAESQKSKQLLTSGAMCLGNFTNDHLRLAFRLVTVPSIARAILLMSLSLAVGRNSA